MADIQKSYLYKVYRGGVYLGLLENVTSEFKYSQDINTPAVQLQVDVNISADVAEGQIEELLDETGAVLTDEQSNILYEERRPDIVGGSSPAVLIQENNNLKVYEISADDLNGVLVFDGWIESWEAGFGDNDNNVSLVAVSRSIDLNDYVVGGAITADVSQTSENSNTGVNTEDQSYGQTFKTGAGVASLHSITIKLARPTSSQAIGEYRIALFASVSAASSDWLSGGSLATALGYSNYQSIDPTAIHPTYVAHTFQFITPVTVTPATTYFFVIRANPSNASNASARTKSVTPSAYADGNVYSAPSPIQGYASDTSQDLYFITYEGADDITAVHTNEDPTNILKDALDSYSNAGGSADYDGTSTDDTGLSVTYTFRLATALEIVKKCLELAPSDWYWYVDPATLIVNFKQTETTATHRFMRGKHIQKLKLMGTVENVRNVVYFSGGDVGGGVNLFIKSINTAGIDAQGRQRLERISDNRVTVQATAELIAGNLLDDREFTAYSSPITILASNYDVDTINVGDTAKIAGFGNFMDYLILQIARITRLPDRVELTLGVLLRRQSDALRDALDDLDKLQTVDNPDAPS